MTVSEAKKKLIALAKAELGYREGNNNYTKYADDPGITKLYGWTPQHQPWCCVFANWCFLTAFGYDLGSKLTYGGTAACSSSAQLFKSAGAWSSFPEVGDQAFFYSGGGINHTGLVVSVEGTSFTTIEGNYSDKVSSVRHNVGANDVAGFGRPNWELADSTPSTSGPAQSKEEKNDYVDHSLKLPTLRQSNVFKPAVVIMQAILNERNFPCGTADGEFGPKTAAALNRFQAWAGLEVDTVCGPKTWKALFKTG